jgi:heptosyltransferase-2
LLSFIHANRQAVLETGGRPLVVCLGIRPAWADLFRDDSRVDELMILERGGRYGGPLGTMRLAGMLKQGNFDAILLCPPSLRTGMAAWLSGISTRVGYRSDGRSLLLTHGIRPQKRGSLHYSREMVHLGAVWLKSLGLPDAIIQDEDGTSSLPGCDSLTAAVQGPGAPLWAVAPGTTYGEAKTWPVARLADFVQLVRDRTGARIVFLGDAAASGFTARLKDVLSSEWSDDLEQGASLTDLTGKTDLMAAVRVLKASQVFVGNDSGLMHLAAALGLPTVGIFGSSNPDWTAPLGTRTQAVYPEGFDCRPCYRKTCNQKLFCLETVSGESVLGAAVKLSGDGQTMSGGV